MGRYTTSQSYADIDANARTVPYEQAVGSSTAAASSGANPPSAAAERVVNPYGSTAGAGSGEFHVYRHARNREMERLRNLDDADARAKADAEFEEKVGGWREEEELRLERRRKKRRREKEARERKKNLRLGGIGNVAGGASASTAGEGGQAKVGKDEFQYTPVNTEGGDEKKDSGVDEDAGAGGGSLNGEGTQSSSSSEKGGLPAQSSSKLFANDGSFLEMMKRKMAEDEATTTAFEVPDTGTSTSKSADARPEDGEGRLQGEGMQDA